MKLLKSHTHESIDGLEGKTIYKRLSSRAIAVRANDILLLHTDRYRDYSLPGGGLEPGEDKVIGLVRELTEETGAKNIRNIKEFGIYEEYRPWYKPEYDIVHMISYCYFCDVDQELGETKYESYEISNGMKPVWVNIFEAIRYNKETLQNSKKKGLSLEREIFLLEKTVAKLAPSK